VHGQRKCLGEMGSEWAFCAPNDGANVARKY
jgi:hypothetical protein